jgi:hypothetical protein
MVEEIRSAVNDNQHRQSVDLDTMSMECAAYYLRISAEPFVTTCRQYTLMALQAENIVIIFNYISVNHRSISSRLVHQMNLCTMQGHRLSY